MPNPEPVPGKCNAKRRDGQFCANGPHQKNNPKNKRCKFHGGMNTGPKTAAGKARVSQNATKHGLYAKRLKATFKDPGDAELWDELPTDTDLTNEIQLFRMLVVKYSDMLATGVERVEGHVSRMTGEMVYHSVQELRERAARQLREMIESQQRMHPEAATKGDLSITVKLASGNTADVEEEDVPDLDAEGSAETPHTESPLIAEEAPPKADNNPLAGLDDDD